MDAGVVSLPAFPVGNKKLTSPLTISSVERYKGSLVFEHKTGGVLQLFKNPEDFERHKKITNRKGQQSVLRNVLFAGGRAV